ncbi:MAG: MFS transporter [bacterium]|nr:MFS transporter [bacterium]MCP5032006.1 MFS transporter [Actinomycetes bacterium]
MSNASGPLGTRFWRVWTASTASNIGDGIVVAGLPLLAAQLTRDPFSVAATTIIIRLPWLVFGLFAGVMVDRTDRLRLMVATDIGRAVMFTLMAVAIASGNMTLIVLYVAVFGVGILETLFDTAAMSITPAVVDVDQLEQANARINGAQIVANEFIGPPLGGVVFAVAAAAPFGFNAITFAVSAAILITVPGQYKPEQVERGKFRDEISAGLSFVWREPLIRAFAVGAGAINLGFTAAAAVLVLHAQDNLGLGAFEFGLLLASAAVGGLSGAQLAPAAIERLGRRYSVLLSIVGIASGIAVLGAADSLLAAAAGFSVFGFSAEIWNIVSMTYRQSITPDRLMGRVMAGFRVIAYGAYPAGAAIGGLIASTVTIRATFLFGSATVAMLLPYMAFNTSKHNL